MNKYKYLVKNFGLLTLSSFGTKILSFVLIPLYTRMLTTSEYGTYDYYSTTVSLAIPLLTLNIVEAVMRFALDKKNDPKDIFSIGIRKIFMSIFFFTFLVILNVYFKLINIFVQYAGFLIILYISMLVYDLLSQFARGIEQIKYVAVAGAINTISLLFFNIYFLIYQKIGLKGYFLANCLSLIIPSIYYMYVLKIWNYFTLKTNKLIEKDMLSYSKPLVFNTIAWWINNVSDRYVVTWICGVAANGIYSVAYKIPSILNVLQSIFNQAWMISAVKEFDSDGSRFYSKIYNLYNIGMVIMCSLLLVFNKVIARLLFADSFYMAWKYAPFLMISVVFGALSGLLGGVFSAAKQSKIIAITTLLGAGINVVLNVLLVFIWGPIGAAISTMISYFIVWVARIKMIKTTVDLYINLPIDILAYCLLVCQATVALVLGNTYFYVSIQMICFLILIVLYHRSLLKAYRVLISKMKG